MKKLLALVLALCLVLGLGGCRFINKTTAPVEFTSADSGTLYWHSMELAGLIDDMLKTPEYFELMGGSDTVSEVIMPLMRSDLSEPESAYVVTLPEDALPTLMSAAEVDLDGFSDGLREFVERRMVSSVPTILNSRQGAETLAASSILTVSGSWAGEVLDESCYVLLMYPYCCPVMASFTGSNGVVTGTATMLLGEPLEEDSLDAVEELFGYLEMEGPEIEGIDIDALI